ncbi:hypothetical protein FO519_006969 [Halicephalobus sp. NKZ332]|nr:hypothetical protein FO519_006969 [Halicephalobus sp. NKZ332]
MNGIRGIGVCISAFSLIFYSVLVIIGVFREKRFLLLPFLIVQGIIALSSIIVTAAYGIIGAASDSLVFVHKNVTMVRDLYKVHHMDPDDEKIQTLFSCGLLIGMFLFSTFQAYIWITFYQIYKYFTLKDTIIGPERGYQRGKIVADTLNQEY